VTHAARSVVALLIEEETSMTTLRERTKGRSELGVAALLLVLGALVLWDTSQISSGIAQTGPVGPKAVPSLIAGMLIVCGVVLAIDVLRGGHAEAEGGEDVDLNHPSDWRTVLLLVAAFLANVLLIDPVGWWFSGAVLFWGSAYALGSRRYVRDAAISFALSFATYYIFAAGLGIGLPAGVLQGIL
jgi:putative tricarboxylic transport membrane protein